MVAVFAGAGYSFDDRNITGDSFALLQQFESNVYFFSSFKNYQQLLEANKALRNDKGEVRNFDEFKREVQQINLKYNVNWLNAEYGHAVASAQMATQWHQIQQQAEILPLLQYETVRDDRVREAHRMLDGTIKPVGDAFWKIYYPPNGWNCRCSVRQLDAGTVTPNADIVYPELLPMFRGNIGIDQVIFPKKHPYIENTAAGKRPAIIAKAKELTPKRKPD